MPKPLLLLPLSLAIALATGQAEAADPWRLCPATDIIPPFRDPAAPPPAEGAVGATEAEATTLDVSRVGLSTLQGDVILRRGQQWLGAERVVYEHQTQRYSAEGGVRYEDPGLRLTARGARGDQAAGTVELDDIAYQMVSLRGNGRAERVEVAGDDASLFRATYSTCDPRQRLWEIQARRVNVDREEGLARIHEAQLRLGRVTVLYLPYLVVPVDDRRRTGLLYPTIGQTETSGLEIRLPYYINIAPNYDATITPRILGKRGLMLGGEFRYLTERHRGIVEADWLPSDRISDRRRSYLRLNHHTAINADWHATANLRSVSDRRYFEDFGENAAQTAVSFIDSTAGMYGRGRYWQAELSVQDWQTTDALLPDGSEPFRRLPRALFAWEQPLLPWATAGLRSELVAFDHDVLDGGRRIDIKPWLRLPFEGDAWFVHPEFAWRYTHYDLDRSGGDRKPSRSLPIASMDMGAFFERDAGLFGRRFVQTLEPRLYYLRVPYREQADIPVFDTQDLTFGYAQLFRDNRFAGADRQGDANQATAALTTRLFDAGSGREWLSASLGQIRYFDPPRVLLPGQAPLDRGRSAWVLEADAHLDDRWSFGASQQWDPELSATTLSSLRAQRRFGDGGVFNLAYRYRRDLIEQAEASFVYPISHAWRLVGRWNHSLLDDSTLEAFGGIEWESCCMAVRIVGRHYVRNREGEKNNALYFEIELKGLGSFGRDTGRLLQGGILGYSR